MKKLTRKEEKIIRIRNRLTPMVVMADVEAIINPIPDEEFNSLSYEDLLQIVVTSDEC